MGRLERDAAEVVFFDIFQFWVSYFKSIIDEYALAHQRFILVQGQFNNFLFKCL